MAIRYQKLLPEHATQYCDIRLESLKLHPEHFGSKYEEQIKLPELRLERTVKEQDKDSFVMGAFAAEDLIGIFAFTAHNEFGLAATGTLIQMYVQKAFSGQKVGLGLTKALLKATLERPDTKQIILQVNPRNARAIRVYEQAGFQTFIPAHPTEGKFMIFPPSPSGKS